MGEICCNFYNILNGKSKFGFIGNGKDMTVTSEDFFEVADSFFIKRATG